MTASRGVFVLVIALVGLVRLGELVVSRGRLRARRAAWVPEPRLFPLMAALHAGLLGLPLLEVFALERPFVPALALFAGATLTLATGLRVWTLATLGRSWNVWVVTPPPAEIVTHGPYAWIRHPNYLVVVLEVLALPLLHTAWVSTLALSALNALVLARRIATEEAALAQVPAWREAFAGRKRLIPWVL